MKFSWQSVIAISDIISLYCSDTNYIVAYTWKAYPTNIFLLKSNKETIEKEVKYVQS